MAYALAPSAPSAIHRSAIFNRRLPTRDQWLRSEAVWAGLIAYLALAKILSDTLVPITFRSEGQASLFSWSGIVTYGLLGLVGLWCARATGFPAAWDARISSARRLLIPAIVGVTIGLIALVIDVQTAGTQALARVTGQPSFNIDYPGSLLAYSGGAIEVETLFRLFSLPALVWLISSVLLRGRGLGPALWVIGGLAAAFEPVAQGVFLFASGGGVLTPLMLGAYMVTALPENILAVVFFRRYGLLAPIVLRLGEYAIFHIVYGNFLYATVFPA